MVLSNWNINELKQHPAWQDIPIGATVALIWAAPNNYLIELMVHSAEVKLGLVLETQPTTRE